MSSLLDKTWSNNVVNRLKFNQNLDLQKMDIWFDISGQAGATLQFHTHLSSSTQGLKC